MTADEARASGKYPVVDLSIFDKVYELEFDSYILEREEEVKQEYIKYLKELSSMRPLDRKKFLRVIKNREIRDNHHLEHEDDFDIELHQEFNKANTIDFLLKHRKRMLTKDKFIKAHKIMLDGTHNSQYKNYYWRSNNNKCVGTIENGRQIVQYFPIDYRELDVAAEGCLRLYNYNTYNEHLLLKPQIIHGLVAATQLFEDGNTRFARILQNVKIFELSEYELPYRIDSPAVYGTREYFPYREKYRDLIYEIVKNNDDEAWNNWFSFNLDRFEENVMFLSKKKEYIRRR